MTEIMNLQEELCDPEMQYCSPDDPNLYEPGIGPLVAVWFIDVFNMTTIFILTAVQTLFNVTDVVDDALNGARNVVD